MRRLAALAFLVCILALPARAQQVFVTGPNSAPFSMAVGGGADWMALDGVVAGGMDACFLGNDTMVLAARSTDNAIWLRWRTGTAWSAWFSIGGLATSDPAVACAADFVDVLTRGPDGALWQNVVKAGSTAAGDWTSAGGAIEGAPDAARKGDSLVVAARGRDGTVWVDESPSPGQWSGWRSIGGAATSDPSVVAFGSRFDVFVSGPDRAVWHAVLPASGPAEWVSEGGSISGGPDAAASGSRLDVVARGADNAVWIKTWNGSAWSAWQSLGGLATGDPTVVPVGPPGLAKVPDGGVMVVVAPPVVESPPVALPPTGRLASGPQATMPGQLPQAGGGADKTPGSRRPGEVEDERVSSLPSALPTTARVESPIPAACQFGNWDFEANMQCWSVEGSYREGGTDYNAFLSNPVPVTGTRNVPPISTASGSFYVNTDAGPGIGGGQLVSQRFQIPTRYVTFLMGGGAYPDTRVELLVRTPGGEIVRSDGRYRVFAQRQGGPGDTYTMRRQFFDASSLQGQTAVLRLVAGQREHRLLFDDVRFEDAIESNWDFDRGLESWTVAYGEAFASQPTHGENVTVDRALPPGFDLAAQRALGGDYWNVFYPTGRHGDWWIGTNEDYPQPTVYDRPEHSVARGRTAGDGRFGAIVSIEFVIEQPYIHFLVGGGRDPNIPLPGESARGMVPASRPAGAPPSVLSSPQVTLGVVLQVNEGGRWVDRRYATGRDSEIMDRWLWDVRDRAGQNARIVIVDDRTGPWGHVNADDFVFTNNPRLRTLAYGRGFVRDAERDEPVPLWGFLDAHTHPMNHLGWGGGGRLFWGEPTGPVEQALRPCDGRHLGTVDTLEIAGRRLPLGASRNIVQNLENVRGSSEVARDPMMETAVVTLLDILGLNDTIPLTNALRAFTLSHPATAPAGLALGPGVGEAAVGGALVHLNAKRAEFNAGLPHVARGYPDFPWSQATGRRALFGDRLSGTTEGEVLADGWPHYQSRLHQQMHVSWIRRAHQGGLRLLAAHISNTELMADMAGNPQDVRTYIPEQIAFMRQMARDNRDFMEIAESPAEARRIIGQGKLAVVLGIEIVTIDRLLDRAARDPFGDLAQRLRGMGIRHIYPIHSTNNSFGGTAVYSQLFNINNYYLNGSFYRVADGTAYRIPRDWKFFPSGLHKELRIDELGLDLWPFVMDRVSALGTATLSSWRIDLGDLIRKIDTASRQGENVSGQVNADGLTADGDAFVRALMRSGAIIDIDHASIRSRQRIIELARAAGNYPLTSSHSDINAIHDRPYEATLLDPEIDAIGGDLGGMVNPVLRYGTDVTRTDGDSCLGSSYTWLLAYRYLLPRVRDGRVGFGSDFDGFLGTPAPRFGRNSCRFTASSAVGRNFAASSPSRRNAVRYTHYPAGASVVESPNGGLHHVWESGASSSWTSRIPLDPDQTPLRACVTGVRTFDVNVDGPVHIGLLPDFYQDVANMAGDAPALLRPIMTSAESYIRMWERAETKGEELRR